MDWTFLIIISLIYLIDLINVIDATRVTYDCTSCSDFHIKLGACISQTTLANDRICEYNILNDFECTTEGKYSLHKEYPYKIIINGNNKTLVLREWNKNFIHLYNNGMRSVWDSYYPYTNGPDPSNTLDISISNLQIKGLQSPKFVYLLDIYSINVTLTSLSFSDISFNITSEYDYDPMTGFIDIKPFQTSLSSNLLLDSCSITNLKPNSAVSFLYSTGVSSTIKNCEFANVTFPSLGYDFFGVRSLIVVDHFQRFNMYQTNFAKLSLGRDDDVVLFRLRGTYDGYAYPPRSAIYNNSLLISDVIIKKFTRSLMEIKNVHTVEMKNCKIMDLIDPYAPRYYLDSIISLTYDTNGPPPTGSSVVLKNFILHSIQGDSPSSITTHFPYIFKFDYPVASNITIEDNIVKNVDIKTSWNYGGDVLTIFHVSTGSTAKLVVENNTFVGNTATAVTIIGTKYSKISNNVFENNTIEGNGQISFGIGSDNVVVINCTFTNNFAKGDGGAIYVSSNAMNKFYVVNSKFIRNLARNGGAIFLEDGVSNPMILSLNEYAGIVEALRHKVDDSYTSHTIVDVTNELVSGWYVLFDASIDLKEKGSNKDTIDVAAGPKSVFNRQGKAGMVNVPGVDAPALLVESKTIRITVYEYAAMKGTYVKVSVIPIIPNSQDVGYCVFIGNQAAGDSTDSFKFVGGAIAAVSKINFLIISGAQFINNVALEIGGAVYVGVSCRGFIFYEVNMTGNSVTQGEGGALALSAFNAGFVIRDSIFTHNTATEGGAIMFGSYNGIGTMQEQSNVGKVINTYFSSNEAIDGGSLYFRIRNYVDMITNTIEKSVAQNDGAAIYSEDGNVLTMRMMNITQNVAENGNGGGIFATKNSSIMFEGNFTGNRADQGGALHIRDGVSIVFRDTIISGNIAEYFGGGIFGVRSLLPTVSSSRSSSPLIFTMNEADYGSALSLMETIPNSPGSRTLKGSVFNNNRAKKGGTIFHLKGDIKYDHNASSSSTIHHDDDYYYYYDDGSYHDDDDGNYHYDDGYYHYYDDDTFRPSRNQNYDDDFIDAYTIEEEYEPYPFNNLNFAGNKAPYGEKVATQPTQIESPTNHEVTVYNDDIPELIVTIRDFYGQVVEGDSVSTMSIDVESSACNQRTRGRGIITGSTIYSLKKGRGHLNKIQTLCNPEGSITSKVSFTTSLATDIIRAGSSLVLEDFKLNASTLMTFRQCIDGETSATTDCVLCETGTYSLKYSESARCKQCNSITGISFCNGNQIELLPGYWRRISRNEAVIKCPMDSLSCKGGNSTGNDVCNVGYTGPLCDVCDENYFKSEGRCNICENGSMTTSGLVALIFFIVLIFFITFQIYKYKRKNEDHDSENENENDNFILRKMKDKIEQLKDEVSDTTKTPSGKRGENTDEVTGTMRSTIAEVRGTIKGTIVGEVESGIKRMTGLNVDVEKGENNKDKGEETRGASGASVPKLGKLNDSIPGISGISTQIKVIVSTIQIVTSVSFSLSVSMPIAFDSFTDIFSWINLSPSDIVPMGCYQIAYPLQLLGTTIAPIIFFILLYMVYKIEKNAIDKSSTTVKPDVRQDADKIKKEDPRPAINAKVGSVIKSFMMLFFYISFTILPGITTKIFNAYPCTDIDPNNEDNENEDEFLRVDLSVSCSSDMYSFGTGWASLMILVYPIGIPLFYFILLFLVHDLILHTKVDVDTPKKDLKNSISEANNYVDERKKLSPGKEDDKYTLYLKLSQLQIELVKLLETLAGKEEIHIFILSADPKRCREELWELYCEIQKFDDKSKAEKLLTWKEKFKNNSPLWKKSLFKFVVFLVGEEKLNKFLESSREILFESLSFLYAAYEGKFWYWEIIETVRRLVLTAVISVCLPGSGAQSVLALLFATIFIKLYSYYQPYQFEIDDIMGESGQWQVYFTFLGALIIQNDILGSKLNSFVGFVLVVVNATIMIEGFSFQFASEKTKNIWMLPIHDGEDTNDTKDSLMMKLKRVCSFVLKEENENN